MPTPVISICGRGEEGRSEEFREWGRRRRRDKSRGYKHIDDL
jgi:hypothetical protein